MNSSQARKVGVITLNGGLNYGNKLQNYAMLCALRNLGFEAETLENVYSEGFGIPLAKREKGVLQHYTRVLQDILHYRYGLKNTDNSIASKILYVLLHKRGIRTIVDQRKKAFSTFEKQNLNLMPSAITDASATKLPQDDYYAFVVGSDQVWNPHYKETSDVFFLQFAQEKKRIAYAPSFGVSQIPETIKKHYSELLRGIPSLSVREQKGAELIRDLCGRSAEVVLDPTMLLMPERWREVEKKPETEVEDDFLITYFLGDITRKYRKEINGIAKKNHLKVIDLQNIRYGEVYSADPYEFLYYIDHARFVCTDSFHGTVFSLLFHKPFAVFFRQDNEGNMISRLESLLQIAGFPKNSLEKNPILCDSIDYPQFDARLEEKRSSSIGFLSQALDSVSLGEAYGR